MPSGLPVDFIFVGFVAFQEMSNLVRGGLQRVGFWIAKAVVVIHVSDKFGSGFPIKKSSSNTSSPICLDATAQQSL